MMKGKSGLLFVFAVAWLVALVLGRRPGPANEPAPTPVITTLTQGWPAAIPLRITAKRQIAREVIAGERSLLESAALFRELNRLPPRLPDLCPGDPLMRAVRGASPGGDEELCVQVISWVRSSSPGEMPGRDAAAARLEAEFLALVRDGGAIRLPDAASVTPVQDLIARARNAMTQAEWEACLGRPDGGGAGP
jgi:hypothetical protein